MKIVTLSSEFNRSHYLFYRERAVDRPKEYYEVTFYNSCGEWIVKIFDPDGNILEGLFTEKFKTLSQGILAVDEVLSNLTGETK